MSERSWILDLDMGNTRIKWRLRRVDELGSCGAMLYDSGLRECDAIDILNAMAGAGERGGGGQRISRIRVASVAGGERNRMLRDWCRKQWQREPEFARVTAVCAGVSNGYEDFSKIGVDRWLGVLAAYNRYRRGCLVVDCGSAVTVDMVTGSGNHLGGYIVPGLRLMRSALFQETDAVKVSAAAVPDLRAPGRDTSDAVNKGLLLMVRGLIAESRRQLRRLAGEEPVIVLSGGDAPELIRHWLSANEGRAAELLPDLVLDGLALAIP